MTTPNPSQLPLLGLNTLVGRYLELGQCLVRPFEAIEPSDRNSVTGLPLLTFRMGPSVTLPAREKLLGSTSPADPGRTPPCGVTVDGGRFAAQNALLCEEPDQNVVNLRTVGADADTPAGLSQPNLVI